MKRRIMLALPTASPLPVPGPAWGNLVFKFLYRDQFICQIVVHISSANFRNLLTKHAVSSPLRSKSRRRFPSYLDSYCITCGKTERAARGCIGSPTDMVDDTLRVSGFVDGSLEALRPRLSTGLPLSAGVLG